MSRNGEHCSFVLLAEFDIDKGAQLTYQFPQPLGTDEGLLANLMLPDGAEKQLEDWTIFFLNQTPFNTIAPVLALETAEDSPSSETGQPELLYVLNLVRTKHDKAVRRGAVVKAMAICTRHPFIQIFKPVLLLALDDYFTNPSQDCLARLFDAINSMDISAAPVLTRSERLVMRNSERKDVFVEKFVAPRAVVEQSRRTHRHTPSNDSHSSFDEGILVRTKDGRERAETVASVASTSTGQPPSSTAYSPSDNSFSLGGSAVWVGDESALLDNATPIASSSGNNGVPTRGRRSTDASSSTSSHPRQPVNSGSSDPHLRPGLVKDTHFFQTMIDYKGHQLPIRMPLATFSEEVGEYSLIQLVQTLSNPMAAVSGPLHPHLHTNGSLTHPIMILFNALITGKRVIFLGHNRPAGQVSSYVLSACALGSGCGTVLTGFVDRAFPYANLTNRDEWEALPSYIAGVINPIFEPTGNWDLLVDVGGGRMVVSKDIHTNYPPTTTMLGAPPLIARTGTFKAESTISEEDIGRSNREQKSDFTAKADNPDNVFIEDIITAINYHFGEGLVRARFTEYVHRFVRLASRYEEEVMGTSTIGYPSTSFAEGPGDTSRLGSGMVFLDDSAGARELAANASRIEGWRRTQSYREYQKDSKASLATNAIQGFDVLYQVTRLRYAKNIPDAEAELIMHTMLDNVYSYEQVVELLAMLPAHAGGLLPLSFGLFHQQEIVRDLTVDLFTQLRMYPVGVQALQALNHFQRYAYVRQAHARENRGGREMQGHLSVPPAVFSRTLSSRSDVNIAAG
ncbi:spindle pole body interacting protein [Amylostereum chailletii]|nr:spindle pole body interacting protein [Amylostereum chailletii]